MTSDIFDSPRQMLDRAEEHIAEFNGRIKAFFDKNPWSYVTEPNNDRTQKIHKLKLTKKLPARFANIASDAAHNLRSALDQAGYATAVSSGFTRPKSTYFPFAQNSANLEGVIRRRCKNLPDEVISLFRAFKPYRGGDDLLWAINEVANANKHRLLTPVSAGATTMYLREFKARGVWCKPVLGLDSIGGVKDEIVICITDSTGEIEHNITLISDVAFDEIDVISGQPAGGVLHAMAGKVQSILMATEAEAKRIGLI